MSAQVLRLEVAEAEGADRWHWVLKDPQGVFLADHAVALDRSDPRYGALFDLPGYLRHHVAPDRREAEEGRLLADAGDWIGEQLLGQPIGQELLRRARPLAVVRVLVPAAMERLLTVPLEMARIGGQPLSRQGVSSVFETAGSTPAQAAPIGERLRLLALFSLPPTASPLNLRRERQMLRRLVAQLTGSCGLAVELRVLQYGVTRDSLREVLEEGEGWDVIHFSGHGLPGSLLLETPDGSRDPLTSEELAGLLRQAGSRLKLVTLSACLSAAASIEQTLAWLGIAPTAVPRRDAVPDPAAAEALPKAAPMLARALVEALDCAVLAMRYPVEDEFAIDMAAALYEGLFDKRQALPRAAHLALQKALGGKAAVGALSAAAPALFGARAAELMLVPPRRSAGLPGTDLAYFPREPAHFVGRVAAMTRASAALALDSGSAAEARGLAIPSVEGFDAPMGRGVTGTVEDRRVAVGNARLMAELGVDPGPLAAEAERLRGNGATVFFVAADGRPAGLVAVADPVKETTPAALAGLKAEGIRVVMLTGDNRTTAEAVARRLGITEVEAEVLPEDKQRIVERLKAEGRHVAMAGDGVNDAPALAAAEVGIAMGTGTDVAIESAGVTLLGGDLTGIVRARRLSRAVMRNIRENLFFAFAYNAAGVPIAAGVLYPFFGILLSPLIAAAAMALSSVSVVGNALRLRTARLG